MYFFEKKTSEIFRFVTLPIKIPNKKKFHTHTPGNSTKFCFTPLAILRPKTKIHGNAS